MKIVLLFIFSILFSLTIGWSQSDDTPTSSDRQGVVISTEEDDIPDQSAILHVKNQQGETKGMKFPVLKKNPTISNESFEVFSNYLSSLTEGNPNGLLFYQGEGTNQGFYYYDDYTPNKWLEIASDDKKKIGIPDGTIIQYVGDLDLFVNGVGKPGSPAEGWYICNGENGTPNLTASFVKGFSGVDNNNTTEKNESDFITLDVNNMPQHSHKIQDYKMGTSHDHTVLINEHTDQHQINYKLSPRVGIYSWRKPGHIISFQYSKRKDQKERDLASQTFGLVDDKKSSAPIEGKTLITPDAKVNPEWLKPYGATTVQPLDVRPSYFVLVYIMKIEKKGEVTSYIK